MVTGVFTSKDIDIPPSLSVFERFNLEVEMGVIDQDKRNRTECKS